jgi:hypothetical protein
MSEKYSDVIIVGTDLAGLITGAFLAKRGLSVTVLNFERDVASEKKNIQPNLITNLESRLFKSILGRLSILDHELQIIRRLEVPFQVVLPRHRIDIFRDRDRLQKEIQREFPLDKISLAMFYESVDHFDTTLDTERLQELILPKTFRSRWKFSQFVKQTGLNRRVKETTDSLGSNREVRALLECQLKFLSQTHSENPFLYQIAKTLSTDNCMLFEVQGGLGHLKKLFLDKIEQFSGKVKNEVRIESFQFEKRRLQSIQLGGFEGALGCKYLLWNDEVRGVKEFLPKKFRNRRLVKKIKAIQPKFYHFSVQYELDPTVIPVGMRENLLFIGDPEQALTGTNFLHLNLFHRTGEDGESPPSLLTVSYLLEAPKLQEPSEFFQEIHGEMSTVLHRLLPFSEGKIRLSFPLSHPKQGDPGTLFPMEKSDFEIFRENASANPVYQLAPQNFGDLFPINNRTAYKNLFLTSPEILAALGSEGKFLLGLKTIDLIWGEVESSRKKAIKQRKIA